MPMIRTVAVTLWSGMLILGAAAVSGQDYPIKSIRIITSEAGGGNDMVSRLIGQGISIPLGQAVVIENRGFVGFELAAKAAPDGYTLLLNGTPFWIGPLLQKVPYDPVREFSPITLAIRQPNMILNNMIGSSLAACRT